ncbi:MAG: hypothetical protein A2X64_06655 [Ignavibacteria bacterium GWF2_33_9]|nr:MAG: hypothetical protein A2X64_06655 [Ignavibacteria bacterium GWF2_33_9]
MNKGKINIVFLSDFPFSISFGGKEIQMQQYYKTLMQNYQDNINVKYLNYRELDALNDVQIIHFFGYSNWYHDITKLMKTKHPNIKIVVSPTFYISNFVKYKLASVLFNKFSIPNFFSYKYDFFNEADLIICNSNAEKEQLKSIFSINNSGKIQIIPNAIEDNFNQIDDIESGNIFLNEYGINSGYILSVSFLDERKNSIKLIEAYLSVADTLNRKLVLIGMNRYVNQKNNKYVNELIKYNQDKIIHVDYLDRDSNILKSAYKNAALHILPSILETPGISNIEAAAFGLPILVGKCKPVQEYFGNLAIFVDSNSEKDIADKLLKHFTDNNKDNLKNSKSLQKEVLHKYTLKKVSEELFSKYTKLIE